ncbi:SRPBCC family protein [Sagittula stellata]|uniref:SRPBCC family protein n=1 Tax=Sagittula stellata TaxID=52603 RepID=UPI0002DF4E0B
MTYHDIDASAPVAARADILIDAPASAVWAVLSDIQSWPAWFRNVEWISAHIPPVPGTAFEMRASGQTVRARLQVVDATHQLGWTGTALFVSTGHLVTLEDRGKATHVHATASYRGAWPLALSKQAKRHAKALLIEGLADLKAASEGKKPTMHRAA